MINMSMSLAIALGGAIGALMRYFISRGVHLLTGPAFPYGTMFVNVSGCLIMGVIYTTLIERSILSSEWRAAIQIGFLGAFTTFSTFSIETLNLVSEGAISKASINIALTVSLCLIATWLGMVLGRQL